MNRVSQHGRLHYTCFVIHIFAIISTTTYSRIKEYNLNDIFIVNTVTDAATGQPEAVNIAKEEEPDEVDLNTSNNPFILPGVKSVGPNSFVDFR